MGPSLFAFYTTPLVILFAVSMSPTICMLMTPKYIYNLTIGTLIPDSLSSQSVLPVFKSGWMV